MNHNKNKARPGAKAGQCNGFLTRNNGYICFADTIVSHSEPGRKCVSAARHFDALMDQAARLMLVDSGRFGEHYTIWLSAFCAKYGRPWPGGGQNGR